MAVAFADPLHGGRRGRRGPAMPGAGDRDGGGDLARGRGGAGRATDVAVAGDRDALRAWRASTGADECRRAANGTRVTRCGDGRRSDPVRLSSRPLRGRGVRPTEPACACRRRRRVVAIDAVPLPPRFHLVAVARPDAGRSWPCARPREPVARPTGAHYSRDGGRTWMRRTPSEPAPHGARPRRGWQRWLWGARSPLLATHGRRPDVMPLAVATATSIGQRRRRVGRRRRRVLLWDPDRREPAAADETVAPGRRCMPGPPAVSCCG